MIAAFLIPLPSGSNARDRAPIASSVMVCPSCISASTAALTRRTVRSRFSWCSRFNQGRLVPVSPFNRDVWGIGFVLSVDAYQLHFFTCDVASLQKGLHFDDLRPQPTLPGLLLPGMCPVFLINDLLLTIRIRDVKDTSRAGKSDGTDCVTRTLATRNVVERTHLCLGFL